MSEAEAAVRDQTDDEAEMSGWAGRGEASTERPFVAALGVGAPKRLALNRLKTRIVKALTALSLALAGACVALALVSEGNWAVAFVALAGLLALPGAALLLFARLYVAEMIALDGALWIRPAALFSRWRRIPFEHVLEVARRVDGSRGRRLSSWRIWVRGASAPYVLDGAAEVCDGAALSRLGEALGAPVADI